MDYKHFIGIDVSKSWLDFTLLVGNEHLHYERIENNACAIKGWFKKLKQWKDLRLTTTLICLEHTGIYNNYLLDFFSENTANVCLESGLQIKQSSGIKRGKNDKVDSSRIAMYAYKNSKELMLWQPKREVLNELKYLTTLRSRIILSLKQLKTPLKENAPFMKKKAYHSLVALCKKSIKALEGDLKQLNLQIEEVVKADERLNHLFNLITSVTGIGAITATQLIITTNEFRSITTAKKYACYSGIAPFEHQSGSSIRGKSRVSSMGNKNVKTLLHMAALSASNCKGDLQDYYQRKILEGKNKLLTPRVPSRLCIHKKCSKNAISSTSTKF